MDDDLRDKWLAIDPHHRGMVLSTLRRACAATYEDANRYETIASSDDERGFARRVRMSSDAYECAADILVALVG